MNKRLRLNVCKLAVIVLIVIYHFFTMLVGTWMG